MKLENLLNPVSRTARSDSSDSALPQIARQDIAPRPDSYYRRVPKACVHCRREKSRCDTQRPCHNCVKKGRAKECVDGCYPCRQKKKICDNTWPCPSCVHSDLECVFTPPPIKRPQTRRKGGKAKKTRCNKSRCVDRPCAHCKRVNTERSESQSRSGFSVDHSACSETGQEHEIRDITPAIHEVDDETSVSPITPSPSPMGGLYLPPSAFSLDPYYPSSSIYISDLLKSPTSSVFPNGYSILAVTTSSIRSTNMLH